MNLIGKRFAGIGVLGMFLFLLVGAVFPSAASCAEKAKDPIGGKLLKSDSPLHIAGDRMEVKQQDRTLVFEGHVTVRQDDLTITGSRLKVTALGGGQANQSAIADKIDRIEIEGSVRISQREKIATADKAVYYHQEQKIVLMGNPTVAQGRDKLQGRLITLYIKEGRSVVEGGEKSPVQAVLHPARKEE